MSDGHLFFFIDLAVVFIAFAVLGGLLLHLALPAPRPPPSPAASAEPHARVSRATAASS